MAKDFLTKIYINHTSETHNTSIPDPNDSWDRAHTSTSHHVEGITLETPPYYYDTLEVPFPIDPSREYYLLYAVYSTGDSFGYDKNRSIDFIGLYENRAVAEENLKRVKASVDLDSLGGSLLNMTGESEYKAYFPWNGYFESLSYVEILPCGITQGRKRVTF